MKYQTVNIVDLLNKSSCFDLQFRRDTRHERTNSPTYYRWKTQFIITLPEEKIKTLKKFKKDVGCGKISVVNGQARFSVQDVDDISEVIIPFFEKKILEGKKKKEFELWHKATRIIKSNKGKSISNWKKNNLNSLIEIHRLAAKYKNHPKKAKWLDMARSFAKT